MSAIQVKEYITDEKGNKKSVIIDIDEFHRIERILPAIDPDAEVFESRKNEESIPIEDCNDILRRIESIKSSK
ncbi:MAG: hypothetical protein SCARUB_01486 [Candidatus Scalindua rubra]|uniref:Antitoxin n=1 Tax=Candidatus Scalindua rubra TaxID=1872076 RepID=A0A1E3XCJ9_9BACT|nr:MAG: hypothetical protein SCARUB_01486 [Candidatus Scalindua rubra]